jgi:hypothetical protein
LGRSGSRSRFRCFGAAGTGLLVLLASVSIGRAAETAPRVALIEDPSDTSILPRLRAELSGLGLDVRMVDKQQDERLPHDLVEAARSTDAVAAFRIVLSEDRADVWIADRVTGKVVLREMLPRGPQIDGRVVALRAVELLRVSLMELDVRRPPADAAPPPATLTEHAGLLQDLERSSLTADAVFLWSPGGTSPALGVAAAMAWRPTWIGVRLFGGSMLAPATLSRREGSCEVITRWLGLDATLQPHRTRMVWRPRAGIGLAALASELRGNAIAPYTANKQTIYTLAPRVAVDLGWAVHARLRLTLGVSYFRPVRSQGLMVADKVVANYGDNILVANVGLDLGLP